MGERIDAVIGASKLCGKPVRYGDAARRDRRNVPASRFIRFASQMRLKIED